MEDRRPRVFTEESKNAKEDNSSNEVLDHQLSRIRDLFQTSNVDTKTNKPLLKVFHSSIEEPVLTVFHPTRTLGETKKLNIGNKNRNNNDSTYCENIWNF